MGWGRSLVPWVLAAITLACGTGSPSEEGGDTAPGSRDGAPIRRIEGEVALTCGRDLAFPPSALEDGDPELMADEELTKEIGELIEAFLRQVPEGRESGVEAGGEWRILAGDRERREFTVALGSWALDEAPAKGHRMHLERGGPTDLPWEPERLGVDTDLHITSWGSCTVEPVLSAEANWVDVHLPEDATLDGDDREVPVRLRERACAGGRDPRSHLHEPAVAYGEDAVVVYWTSEPLSTATCPMNPFVDRTLELEEALGDRELRDGSVWPPRPVEAEPYP